MLGQQASLVKYSTPVLVSSSSKAKDAKRNKKQQDLHHTEDILGKILPPKQHRTDNGQLWVQTVLSTPATKNQVIQLSEQLNKRLIQKQAREVGLCPMREQLYEQCFDQVIRQITIDCRQRGLLLVRVRDQYQNQTKAYKKLYESSINHAIRRVIESDKKKQKMVVFDQLQNLQISKFQKQCAQLERSVNELQSRIVQTKESQQLKLREKAEKHKVKVNQIKQNNTKIKTEIQVALQKSR